MKIPRAALVALTVVPSVLGVLAFVPGEARACGMSVRLEPAPVKPTPVQEIARAEKALEDGLDVVAARAVLGSFPRIRVAKAGHDPLETRALRVFALALVRSNGSADERSVRAPAQGEWTAAANLEWAVQALREIDQKRANDPAVQADLGEALAKLPHGEAEAMTLLAALDRRDLMGSPHAYAALAKLRAKTGDQAGAEAAVKRCTEMSRTPGVCKPARPAPAPAAAPRPRLAKA